jgi:hypothetical protein
LRSRQKKKEAEVNLTRLLARLNENGVLINLSKCKFLQKCVTYVGHDLSSKGILPSNVYLAAVRDSSPPENPSELVKFLGILNYYLPHIPDQSTISRPLYELSLVSQGSDKLNWNQEQLKVFDICKNAFINSKALTPFDASRPIVVATDASPVGTCAVLYNIDNQGVECPVFFSSKSLTPTQGKYSQIECEGLAVVHALRKFHKFLYGRKFTLCCDNKLLVFIFSENKQVPITAHQRIQMWALEISGYAYVLKHRNSRDMLPDFLSRQFLAETDPVGHKISFIDSPLSYILPLNYIKLAEHTSKDKTLSQVITQSIEGWSQRVELVKTELKPYFSRRGELTLDAGCLLWGSRVIVLSSLHYNVLELLHSGHPGETRMKLLARSFVWWPDLDRMVGEHVRSCNTCQATRNKEVVVRSAWPTTRRRMERLHADHAVFNGITYLIIYDAFSKWLEIYCVESTNFITTARTFNKFFHTHGFCDKLNTDNGPPFSSSDFATYCTKLGI